MVLSEVLPNYSNQLWCWNSNFQSWDSKINWIPPEEGLKQMRTCWQKWRRRSRHDPRMRRHERRQWGTGQKEASQVHFLEQVTVVSARGTLVPKPTGQPWEKGQMISMLSQPRNEGTGSSTHQYCQSLIRAAPWWPELLTLTLHFVEPDLLARSFFGKSLRCFPLEHTGTVCGDETWRKRQQMMSLHCSIPE